MNKIIFTVIFYSALFFALAGCASSKEDGEGLNFIWLSEQGETTGGD